MIGGGRDRAGDRPAARPRRPRSVPDRKGTLRRVPHQLAELRGHPRGHPLPARVAQGPALCRAVATRSTRTVRRARSRTPGRGSWWWPPARRSYRRSSTSASAAAANGVELGWLDAGDVRALEPEVTAVRGLWSASTGIVDSHAFMSALREDAERAGAMVILGTPVLSGRVSDGGVELSLGGDEPAQVQFRLVINCAGLWAPEVARTDRGLSSGQHPPAALRQGALLRALRALALPPSGLPGAGAGRPRDARDARPRRTGALRPRRAVGGVGGLRLRRVTGEQLLRLHPPLLARAARRRAPARVHRYPSQGDRSRRARRRTSSSTARRCTGCRAWYTSTASSPPGSPPHCRSRTRSRRWSRPEGRSGWPRRSRLVPAGVAALQRQAGELGQPLAARGHRLGGG